MGAAGEPRLRLHRSRVPDRDPKLARHVYFGGGDAGSTPRGVTTLHESSDRGSAARRIPFEGTPVGTLLGIIPAPNGQQLFLFVNTAVPSVYVVGL